MLKNWCLATFAILLTIVGVGFVPFSVPNQEIVVQFKDVVSVEDADAAIAQVSAQLLRLGAEDVQIKRLNDGSLKITYFSAVAVSLIQETFAKQQFGVFDTTTGDKNTGLPFQVSADAYKFTISEIGGGTVLDNGLKGHVFEIETKSSRFYPPDFFSSASVNANEDQLFLARISITINSQPVLIVDYTSRLLPETRAGPIA